MQTFLQTAQEAANHPFFMVLGGIVLYFTIKWKFWFDSMGGTVGFWQDQKDEIFVTSLFGLAFIVWDDEMLAAYYDILLFFNSNVDFLTFDLDKEHSSTFETHYYFLVGPAVDLLFEGLKFVKTKFKKETPLPPN